MRRTTRAAATQSTQQTTSAQPAASEAVRQDDFAKGQAPSSPPTGHGVFKNNEQVAQMNARRGTVFSGASVQGGSESKLSTKCQDLARRHDASMLSQCFQDNRLQGATFDEFVKTNGGVCAASSTEFIRLNLIDQQKGSDVQKGVFRELVGHGQNMHSHFAAQQDAYLDDHANLNALAQKANDAQKSSAQARQRRDNPSFLDKKLYATPSEGECQQKAQQASGALDAYNEARQAHFEKRVGSMSLAVVPPQSKPMDELKQDFGAHFKAPGFYLVNMQRQNNWMGNSVPGHAIAVHIGDKPRLFDSATGEWEFKSKESMNKFMKDYFKEVYPRDFSGGTFEHIHYPDHDPAMAQFLQRRAQMAEMAK
ncbi:MAG: hypothetical protein ABW123_10965 [Cystobacter sp.]